MYQTIKTKDDRIRPLPFPYRGALSIANDIEFTDFAFFEILMKFLNTREETVLGKGLGMEVTSSLFFYSEKEDNFSYFSGLDVNATLSKYSERMDEYLTAGWFDTNHSFGDFNQGGFFNREHAIRVYETLDRIGVQLKIFSNHGGNPQNIGGFKEIHSGDDPNSPHYHTDCITKNGVKYLWMDNKELMLEMPLQDENQKHMIMRLKAKLLKRTRNSNVDNRQFFRPYRLRDGITLKSFPRFRSTGQWAPNLSSLGAQLKKINWRELYTHYGIMIFYQHLGVLFRKGNACVHASSEMIQKRPDVYLSAFRYLNREHKEGRLWVCGSLKLLQYADIIESTKIEYDEEKNRYSIHSDKEIKEDPKEVFQGLTVYVNPNHATHLFYKGYQFDIHYNVPDETGRYSVTVPIQKMMNIWS